MNIEFQIGACPIKADEMDKIGQIGAANLLRQNAEALTKLQTVCEIADGIQALHKGKAGGLDQWTELRAAIAAVKDDS